MNIEKRYIKNLNALNKTESLNLQHKKVCIVGCGGLGGYVINNLARIGVGCITIIDFDNFELSNLNRQLFSNEKNIGNLKVEEAKRAIHLINSEVKVNVIKEALTETNAKKLITGHDCVVDCLDNYVDRFWLAHACEQKQIPIIYGAIAGWYGQVSTIFPGDIAFIDIYGSMEDGSHIKDDQGNLPFTAGVVANIQAAECVKVLLNHKDILRDKILMIDMYSSSFEIMNLKSN